MLQFFSSWKSSSSDFSVDLDATVDTAAFAPSKISVVSDANGTATLRLGSDAASSTSSSSTPAGVQSKSALDHSNFGTQRSLQALAEASRGAVSESVSNAKEVLRMLRTAFIPLNSTDPYVSGAPSHAWTASSEKQLFGAALLKLCEDLRTLLMNPAVPRVFECNDSPSYIVGDLHGAFRDLMTFERRLWPLGLGVCPARAIFLGDYVDRGPHPVEVVSYLFASMLISPRKVLLLRGNHEQRSINGDAQRYGKRSFTSQCSAWSRAVGKEIYEKVNKVFDVLPLAAVVDRRILCTHGGIPRCVAYGDLTKPIDLVAAINKVGRELECENDTTHIMMDLLWADPSEQPVDDKVYAEQKGDTPLYPLGFGPNDGRGGETVVFDDRALDLLRQRCGITHVIRAHECPMHGIRFEKRSHVLTVFSSSFYERNDNCAAAVLIADRQLHVLILENDTNTARAAGTPAKSTPSRRRKSIGEVSFASPTVDDESSQAPQSPSLPQETDGTAPEAGATSSQSAAAAASAVPSSSSTDSPASQTRSRSPRRARVSIGIIDDVKDDEKEKLNAIKKPKKGP